MLQTLITQFEVVPRYWTQTNPPYEVDFLVQRENDIFPLFVPVAGNIAIFGDSSDRSDDIDFLYHRQLEKAFSCRSNQSDRITFFIDGTGAVANRPGSLCIFDFKKLLENHFNWGYD